MSTQTSAGLRHATWLSCGLETLVDKCPWMAVPHLPRPERDFDVVIVGSGYGGAVAAARLCGCTDTQGQALGKDGKLKICVLERGNEYLPGMFPSRQAELPGHIRFATPDAKRQRGVYDGLYDMRWSNDAVALLASGVGGGSLINAGVMEMPKPYVFQEARWPREIRNASLDRSDSVKALRELLGAHRLTTKDAETGFAKTDALRMLAGKKFEKVDPVHVTVASEEHTNEAGVALSKCNGCGDCATGCNYNAKESLDLNLLCLARRAGARIVTGATVLRVAPRRARAEGWEVYVNHTDGHLRDRQLKPFCLRTKRVILAGGAFGSTEILMRSQNERLQLSGQLGRKFSANGDMLVMAHDLAPDNLDEKVNAVADETVDPKPPGSGQRGRRAIGPTITEMIDLRTGNAETDLVIQDLAVPGPLRRLFEEATTTFDVLNHLAAGDWERHKKGTARDDDATVDPLAMKKSLVLAMIGRDDAEGELSLGGRPIRNDADGLLTVSWPQLRLDRRFEDHHRRLGDLLKESGSGGRVVNNLLWRPLSEELEDIFGRQRGPLLTVHPLGGCPMGDDVGQGVTDDCGRVYDAGDQAAKAVHCGLVVLDGSIVPTSLGINPALTIAVLADRAITGLMQDWNLTGGKLADLRKLDGSPRPVFSETVINASPEPTRIELTEQMRGRVKLKGRGRWRQPHEVEITLTTEPVPVADLIDRSPSGGRRLKVAPPKDGQPAKGKLRILRTGTKFDPVSDQPQKTDVVLEADISGWLTLFDFEPSRPWWRIVRVLCAWLLNRGLRDLVQTSIRHLQESLRLLPRLDDRPKEKLSNGRRVQAWLRRELAWIWMSENKGVARTKTVMIRMTVALVVLAALISVPFVVDSDWLSGWWKAVYVIAAVVMLGLYLIRSYIRRMLGLFSRAGAMRLIEYDLRIGRIVPRDAGLEPAIADLEPEMFKGKCIRGVKRLTYARCASPFTQLMSMSLEKFPGMFSLIGRKSPVLELNKRYLARQEVPLLRVVEQHDGFAALVDMLSFALYVIRVVLQVHALSFRKPDAPFSRPHQRLPVAVPGLPIPQIDWLTVDRKTNPPARIRLARYDGRTQSPVAGAPERPVLLIHGYSASGTTFVHHSVPGNLVEILCEHGRDVWVLDMRSSAGLDTAVGDWTFEMMASQDIPVAIEHILSATGTARIDVVAHCMGAAMFGMAVLEEKDPKDEEKKNCLHEKIGRVVFSQVGPAMLLSRTNVLAAYIMRYVRNFLPLENYSFSPQNVSTAGQFLDRTLATMSMPPDEYRRENPSLWRPGKATPWVGTRHRMDALYGRTFRLKKMDSRTLEHIDDFFGPLSVDTVSQVLHFAAVNCVTDTRGIDRYVTPERVKERLRFPMMSIHGEKNGLADPATMAIMRKMLEKAGVPYLNQLAPTDGRSRIWWPLELCSWRAFARRARHLLGKPQPGNEDRVATVSRREEIERLIDLADLRLAVGEPSYLTWLIEDHGHQDCLIGKDAKSICEVVARYLGKPDEPPSVQSAPVVVATATATAKGGP